MCRKHYVFGLSVYECFCPVYVLLAEYLTNQWTEFHQTVVDDVVEGTDELVRSEDQRRQGWGPSKVKYLSYWCGWRHTYWILGVEVSQVGNLLLRACACSVFLDVALSDEGLCLCRNMRHHVAVAVAVAIQCTTDCMVDVHGCSSHRGMYVVNCAFLWCKWTWSEL